MNEYELVNQKMLALEELAEENLDLALQKMSELYFEASEAFNHEACDSIELWINESKSTAFVDFLNKEIEMNNERNTRFRNWIELSK